MQSVGKLEQLDAIVGGWRREGLTIGFVPTMGNLHAGHHSLVARARREADRVVASIFVNPTQFGPNEDFDRYPRTPEADARGLAGSGCDLLFLPSVATMYPYGPDGSVRVRVPGITDILDGAHRPGHFDGVATVVARLFNMVRPDLAVFGRKDYQQLQVIHYLVRDLAFPVRIVGADTVREPDGLAMSSRNQYLDAAERQRAAAIHATLRWIRSQVPAAGEVEAVEAGAVARLRSEGFEVDYVSVRHLDLAPARRMDEGGLVALVAARLGRTRLIDNLLLDAAVG